MDASSRNFAVPLNLKIRRLGAFPLVPSRLDVRQRRRCERSRSWDAWCCCSETKFRKPAPVVGGPLRSKPTGTTVGNDAVDDSKKSVRAGRCRGMPVQPFVSPRPRNVFKRDEFYPRCSPKNFAPQSRDTPPKRDTGIASEKDWGINLLNEKVNESGISEDGSTWYRESGEDLGENGYRCRWSRMGGQCHDGSSEWKETWWEKSDWTGYKELGVEKSGKNAEGDSWWETWQEVLHQDEWSNLARIERSAQKQAKSGTEDAGWYEKWWEKYDAKGWTEKGAHKYGRLNEQSWWEKWGEHYDGRGSVLKWTDKWAETELGTKWGDKWEEKFFAGIGSRQGETWHVSPVGERWSRTWGEEHFGNGKVHKYGKSTTGESWDIVVDEETYYDNCWQG
ncbi:protein EARLY STARVATION 1, chloroplastic-like isoform X2 [Aristolochia californica]|uniref:protein EARLY STARVATION 1, chloroplastic-like isoform X2 n=1 Tax=Aristolochia californica TaxID=171875 RepID=UPI0035DB081A